MAEITIFISFIKILFILLNYSLDTILLVRKRMRESHGTQICPSAETDGANLFSFA